MKKLFVFVLTVVMLALLPVAAVVSNEEPRLCTQADLDFEVTLDYVYEYFALSTDVIVLKWGTIVIGGSVVIDAEYQDGAGSISVVSGVIPISNCEGFERPPNWTCTTNISAVHVDQLVAEGSILITWLSYDEWVETLGPIKAEHNETTLHLLYVEYVAKMAGVQTEKTTHCIPPTASSNTHWEPTAKEIFTWELVNSDLNNTSIEYFWVDPVGGISPTNQNGRHFWAGISMILPAQGYPPNNGYGVWHTNDPDNPEVLVWGRFIIMADGIVIQDVVIAACEGICEAQSYWVRGDESNQSPRIGTPFRAWQ